MTVQQHIRRRFRLIIEQPEFDLAEAALLIAGEEEAGLDIAHYLDRLDELGARARLLTEPATAPLQRVCILNDLMFADEGFVGNEQDYYDPRNSLLNHVLERRTGIPITLSLVYLEVGRRAGIEGLSGVGLPGHFMVRYDGIDEPVFIDVFNGGRLLSAAECRRYISARFGSAWAANDDLFQPISARQLLVRVLRNLKHAHLRRCNTGRALAAVDRILMLEPDSPLEVRDRGLLHLRRGDLVSGLGDLERYGALHPEAEDLEDIRGQAEAVAVFLAQRN